jgi:hypothetical protein
MQCTARLPASHRLQKANLSTSLLFPTWPRCSGKSGVFALLCLSSCFDGWWKVVQLSVILTTSPTYQVQLGVTFRGSTLQRLWPKQSVIGEEARLCSGTTGFHLVRGQRRIVWGINVAGHELTQSQQHRGVYQGETFILELLTLASSGHWFGPGGVQDILFIF